MSDENKTKNILATLQGCKDGCNCPEVNYDCIPSCTYIKLPFKYPDGFTADNFEFLYIVIANHNGVDAEPILYANSLESPENFDLENNFLIFNSATAPCELCLDGGTYAYELTGNLKLEETVERTAKIVLIQCGKMCLKQSLRQLVVECDEEEPEP